ncbi:site-specific DNA-methyltransferase [Salinimicrobium sp. TH3]|uniref:site-specific DNA-methyltransferase n=1 Tax=Salinimicrobium sp. TH3 TaxID=2997342 RepID=UPI00227577D6|nr:site-specific DNA-methyltransferase [Salinimicrobium sp. TH3]MCY2687574.1 site-specific DNA-methyltransferase [Salinimicrobium sp. TH3]
MSIEKIETGDTLTMSKDLVKDNIEKLKFLFPEIVTEGKIDFKVLQEVLGEEIEEGEEYYRLTWAGKSKARREAHKPSTGTLRPAKEESVDWDKTQNLYIEGDNLEVLKLMQKTYCGKIDLIYIDPPYNTGNDFVYKDDYKDNLKNYQKITGQKDNQGNNLTTNSESDGRFHSNWLNMMYPRLILAKNLLDRGGIILMSIDDNEFENLKKLATEIFGSENFVGNFVWRGGRRNAAKLISTSHEYMICFCKDLSYIHENNINWKEQKKGLDSIYIKAKEIVKENSGDFDLASKKLQGWFKTLKEDDPAKDSEHYKWIDKKGVYFASDISRGGGGGPKWEIKNPYTGEDVKIPQRGWAYSSLESLKEDIDKDLVHFNGNAVPCKKRYLHENEDQLVETVFYKDRRGSSKRLKKLFGDKIFDFPKDENIIKEKINSFTKPNALVLDFFAGSSTTAHAVMLSNLEDSGKRKFIQVQLPEQTDPTSSAFEAGYSTLTEIGKERIRRAAKKIQQENPEKAKNLDFGFKVFKLDSTNIQPWDGNPANLEESLFSAQENIKTDRTDEDVLYEILLKYGLDLTLPIEEKEIAGQRVFNVGMGALFICLSDKITTKVADGIGEWKEKLQPATCRVIFKDSGFNDVEKTNCNQILKAYGIEEVKSI